VSYLLPASLSLRKNLGKVNIFCSTGVTRYQSGLSLKKYTVRLLSVSRRFCLWNLRRKMSWNPRKWRSASPRK
jgi:hypothetical protein